LEDEDVDPAELDPPDADSPELDPPELDSPELDSRDADSPGLDSPAELDSPELDSPDADSPAFAGPPAFFFVEAAEDRRSFLAQPLPLKWIVGGTNARVTRPSQSGHCWGPASLRPWKTSNRWPQALHT
jgi:hypothetical protein